MLEYFEDVLPCVVVGGEFGEGGHCGEGVIKNNMVLQCDSAGSDIENQQHEQRVLLG